MKMMAVMGEVRLPGSPAYPLHAHKGETTITTLTQPGYKKLVVTCGQGSVVSLEGGVNPVNKSTYDNADKEMQTFTYISNK